MTAERKEDVDGSSQLQLDELNDLSIPSFNAFSSQQVFRSFGGGLDSHPTLDGMAPATFMTFQDNLFDQSASSGAFLHAHPRNSFSLNSRYW